MIAVTGQAAAAHGPRAVQRAGSMIGSGVRGTRCQPGDPRTIRPGYEKGAAPRDATPRNIWLPDLDSNQGPADSVIRLSPICADYRLT